MRVGILTMPLKTNYGGLIQAYALQTALERMGCEVEILSRSYPKPEMRFFTRIRCDGVRFVRGLCGGKDNRLSDKEYRLVSVNTDKFIHTYMHVSPKLYTTEDLRDYTLQKSFDAYVVGSDQIWRPRYCPCIEDYFLGFAAKQSVRRIAYAASFGVEDWEYSNEETKMCSQLAKSFDAIGVREDSGVGLCSLHLGVKAEQVLDPTLLLNSSDYEAFSSNTKSSNGTLFFYILDHNEKKNALLKSVSEKAHMQSYECMPQGPLYHGKILRNLDKCVYPAPEQWLRSFGDAEMVVTDSFHGAAFSIIFNKSFWVIGNKSRGLARMESLLEMFDLKDRFVDLDGNNLEKDWSQPINWDSVNIKMESWRKQSTAFLTKALFNS